MSTPKRNGQVEGHGKPQSLSETVSKALRRRSPWTDKDELLDVLYWGRQLLALCIGICWGLVPMKGAIALLLYILITSAVGHSYLTWFQEQDDEEFGGFWEIAKEGFGAAFATFMVSWITVYSTVHFDN
ncbi:hypothetical protein niasHT_037837 [Heterodera trifolii]|uniref:Rab5-interacting protein n=1 Tax=Heterodera trifolii TaxID=157864 RepID=A0ABD2IQ90_9BILA